MYVIVSLEVVFAPFVLDSMNPAVVMRGPEPQYVEFAFSDQVPVLLAYAVALTVAPYAFGTQSAVAVEIAPLICTAAPP